MVRRTLAAGARPDADARMVGRSGRLGAWWRGGDRGGRSAIL